MSDATDAGAPSIVVMFVDDDPMILAILARSARRMGYQVVTANDPTTVPATLRAQPVDILVSDVDMPGMTGLELLAQVRAAQPDIVRLLLTAHGSLETALAAINQGEVFRFLTKPWREEDLRDALAMAATRIKDHRSLRDARQVTERRAKLLAALESDHPGISSVARRDGAYTIDVAAARARVAALDTARVDDLWDE